MKKIYFYSGIAGLIVGMTLSAMTPREKDMMEVAMRNMEPIQRYERKRNPKNRMR